jgi:hypothetical protein
LLVTPLLQDFISYPACAPPGRNGTIRRLISLAALVVKRKAGGGGQARPRTSALWPTPVGELSAEPELAAREGPPAPAGRATPNRTPRRDGRRRAGRSGTEGPVNPRQSQRSRGRYRAKVTLRAAATAYTARPSSPLLLPPCGWRLVLTRLHDSA